MKATASKPGICSLMESSSRTPASSSIHMMLMPAALPDRVEARDDRGNTALSVAAWKNHLELAEMMVEEFKANVNSRDSKKWSPLCIASFHGHKEIVQYLLQVRAA